MTALILHPSAHHHDARKAGRAANLRSAVLAVVWLAFAAAVPLGAVFVAAASPDAGSPAHVSAYYQAKVGNP